MRMYRNQNTEVLTEVICNKCGKKLKVRAGIVEEGVFHVRAPWGYFSHKDGEVHSIDLCEECYDQWIQGFKIPVSIEEDSEFL